VRAETAMKSRLKYLFGGIRHWVAFAFQMVWVGWQKAFQKPLGTCSYTRYVKVGKSQGQDFYRVFHCYKDARKSHPNGQLRCEDHLVFTRDVFDLSEFQ
jgi:hypothetical protein